VLSAVELRLVSSGTYRAVLGGWLRNLLRDTFGERVE
jgi:hypothetical protein